jgi:cytochrome c biogenesis protein CcdA
MTALMLAYAAGLLTTLNPCVLPMLPLVLAGTLQGGRAGPLAFAAGMTLSFAVVGLAVATVGIGLGITPQLLRQVAAAMFVAFGLVMLLPPLQMRLSLATSGLATGADALAGRVSAGGLLRPAMIGALAGAVWSPCSGPSLGAAIALATEAGDIPAAAARMLVFGAGASTVLVGLAYGSRAAVMARRNALMTGAAWLKPAIGAIFVAAGIGVLTGLDKVLEIAVLDRLPDWYAVFTTRY